MEILSLGGQPTPQQWDHYDRWWMQARLDHESAEKLAENSPDWAIKIMWKSKLFMNEYWNLSNKLLKNPFTLSLEEIMWSCQSLTQVN